MKQSTGTIKTVIFSLTPLLLLFITAELFLRLLGFHYYPNWTYDDPRWERDPYLLYKPKPNFKSDDGSLKINSFGFRGEEISIKKNKYITRIICMGDSCTFGFEIKWTSYPNELQKLLNSNSEKIKYEVINAGIPDYSSYQGLILLDKRILELNPDIIIIAYGWNDLRTIYQLPDKKQGINPYCFFADKMLNKSKIYQALNKSISSLETLIVKNKKANRKSVHRVSPLDFKKNLESMIKMARSSGIKVFLLTQPPAEVKEPTKDFIKKILKDRILYNTIIRTVSRQLQVHLIDMEAIFKDRKDERLFDYQKKDIIHPNLEGLKLTAYEIYKACININ